MVEVRRLAIAALPPSSELAGTTITLEEENAHYIRDVLRLSPGAKLQISCQQTGRVCEAQIVSHKPTKVEVIDELKELSRPEQTGVLTICMGLPKGRKEELVIEKAAELEAKTVALFGADRSIPNLSSPTKLEGRVPRWQRIAKAATQQCLGFAIPEVLWFSNLEEFLKYLNEVRQPGEIRLKCSLSNTAKPLRTVIKPGDRSHIVVGPEGDLSEREQALLEEGGFLPVTLGPTRLRCETAALTAVAVIQELSRGG